MKNDEEKNDLEENENEIENENPEEENPEVEKAPQIKEIQGDELNNAEVELPTSLPILPLRGLVVYPFTAVPLTVGQPRSIKLVDEVMSSDRLIGLVATKDADIENPEPEDL